MIKFLIEKEFKQLFRNSFLPKLIFIFPCMIIILMPWAANLEIKNINLNIVDNDHSVLSRRLVDKIGASTYFRLTALPDTYDEALLAIEAGSADVVLEIPRDFEKDWVKGEAPRLLVAANAVNGTKGSLEDPTCLPSSVTIPVNWVRSRLRKGLPGSAFPGGHHYAEPLQPHAELQAFHDSCPHGDAADADLRFSPCLNVVGEKEVGTIEQINVTPVGKFTFIAAKLIPYWLIGFVVLTICFVLAWVLYGILRRDISSLSTAWRCFFYRWCRGSGWSYPIIRPRCSRPCLSCGSSCLSLF